MRSRESSLLPLLLVVGAACFYHPTGSTPATDSEAPQDTSSGSTSTSSAGECGDGQLDPGEACDDGNRAPDDGCEDDCSVTPAPLCGNGLLDPGEQCDDGNTLDGDACQADCTEPPVCGDQLWAGNEQCDDGALNGAYGHCNAECSGPGPRCGDQIRNGPEECDDGNLFDDDDCANECLAPRLVFATAATYTGDLGGLDGADAKCAAAAQVLDLPPDVQWAAWLSDARSDPATGGRFDTLYSGYYKLTTGAVVAHGWGELTTLPLAAAIGFDEAGDMLDLPAPVWSNTFRNGTRIGADHCDDWTSEGLATLGRFGVAGATNMTWSDAPNNNPGACSNPLHLYCFQRTAPL
jgi:cysteine-rich repeat protein